MREDRTLQPGGVGREPARGIVLAPILQVADVELGGGTLAVERVDLARLT
jgi:hypothetical protein